MWNEKLLDLLYNYYGRITEIWYNIGMISKGIGVHKKTY